MGDRAPQRDPSLLTDFNPQPGNARLGGAALIAARMRQLAPAETALQYEVAQKPNDIVSVTVDLTTARVAGSALKLNFPFRSYFVVTASSSSATCSMQLNSDDIATVPIPLAYKDSGIRDTPVSQCFITNTAQPGVTITLLFSVTTEFRSGSQVNLTGGGTVQTTGSAMTPLTAVSVTNAATLLFAANTNSKKVTIQLATGSPSIWISGVNTVTAEGGALPGIRVDSGDTYEWQNQGACYAITAAGTATVQLNQET